MMRSLAPGVRIESRYELEKPLGEGAFGAVWRARDVRLSRRAVAVKILKAEHLERSDLVSRFDAEADALALLHHPNVVGVLDRGQWEGVRYLVTEFVDGESLSAWIERHRASGSLPALADTARIFDQILAGVAAAHAVRVPGPLVHRDLKPDNVLLQSLAGGDVTAKVLDFGIAQLGARQGTRTGMLMGTPMYMSPEQAMGQTSAIGPWTDVFALGVMLLECLTLSPQLDTAESLWGTALQSTSSLLPRLSSLRRDVPADVWATICAALAPRASERTHDADAMRRQLAAAWGRIAPDSSARRVSQASVAPTVVSEVPAPAPLTPVPRTPVSSAATFAATTPLPAYDSSHASQAQRPSPTRSAPGVAIGLVVFVVAAGASALWFGLLRRERTRSSDDVGRGGVAATQVAGAGASPDTSVPSASDAQLAAPTGTIASGASATSGTSGTSGACVVDGPVHEIGSRANVGLGLSLVRNGSRRALGWVVPSQYARGGDDSALAEIAADGTLVRWIDREEPSEVRGLTLAPNFIFRVHGLLVREALVERIDRWDNSPDGQVRLRCGALANDLLIPGDPAQPAPLVPDWNAMFFCRSVPVDPPFVFAARARADGNGGLSEHMQLIATTGGSIARARSLWTLPLASARVLSAPNAVAALRSEAPAALAVEPVPSVGYAVAFRHRRAMHFGWLGPNLLPLGALMTVETTSEDAGRPSLAFDGQQVAMVFADRPSSAPTAAGVTPSPYALFACSAVPGQPPSARHLLSSGGSHRFAAAISALASGGWLLSYSEGPVTLTSTSTDSQHVFVQRLTRDLQTVGAPLRVGTVDTASDSRLDVEGDRFVVALMTGRGDARGVATIAGHCTAAVP